MTKILFAAALLAVPLFAQQRQLKWIVILDSPPVAERIPARQGLQPAATAEVQRQVAVEHDRVRVAIASRGAQATGESQLLLNAVYFQGSAEDAASLRALPGVQAVVRMRMYRRLADDQAVSLMNAPAAWPSVGGVDNAGLSRRIGIIDSGIDQTHPSFQDDTLTPPAGFPKASNSSHLAYTTKKVIVARSYVHMLVDGDHPENSRPDDISPRDRVGHGTAVAMLAAGRQTIGPAATTIGIAPKAFLGNYKIFGSPGINDYTFDDVIIAALEDAASDGMDVVTLSIGAPADWGPLDMCGSAGPCDPLALAVNNSAKLGLVVVVAAGNDGNLGDNPPALGTINSPGTAPEAITVGATTNGQMYYQSLRVTGANVPAALQRVNGRFGNGPIPDSPVRARLADVKNLADDGTACRPLGNGTLAGQIAIVDRGGSCTRADKVNYAQQSGAVAVVLVNYPADSSTPPLDGMESTAIPMFLVGNLDGRALRSYLQSNPAAEASLDQALTQVASSPDRVAYFSSRGPAITSDRLIRFGIKPELTAVGTDIYSATQNYDPNGELYSKERYIPTQGTSFSVPIVAGAIALVKQKNPTWTAAQLKSAVVNTANPTVEDLDANRNPIPAGVIAMGVGKLNVTKAVTPAITAQPQTLTDLFGRSLTLNLTNTTTAALNVSLSSQTGADSYRLRIGGASVLIPPGSTTPVEVYLEIDYPIGVAPLTRYEGVVLATTGSTTLRIPFLRVSGDNAAFQVYSLRGDNFIAPLGSPAYLEVKVVNRWGLPVSDYSVYWSVLSGGGRVFYADAKTDSYGVATASVILGSSLGDQAFRVDAGVVSTTIAGRTVIVPAIDSGGVVNAASFKVGQGLAPGSYISIFGAGLSDVTRTFSTPYLPLSLSNVSVSFDLPNRKMSYPGRIHFVKANQVNVQIPWEFYGQTNAQLKVSLGGWSTAVVNVPLKNFSPGFFEYDDTSSGRRIVVGQDETYNIVSGSNAVSRGKIIQLYVNGLGDVTNRPASGEPALADPLSETLTKPEVTIGGKPAQVQFSGLAPTLIGCYQLNVVVPVDAPMGIQPIALTIGGIAAQTSLVPIR